MIVAENFGVTNFQVCASSKSLVITQRYVCIYLISMEEAWLWFRNEVNEGRLARRFSRMYRNRGELVMEKLKWRPFFKVPNFLILEAVQ